MPPPGGRRALTLDELGRLLSVAHGAIRVLIDLSGRNGLRPAEARGLQWPDVDLAAGVLRVKGQLDENDELAPPKTKASARAIRLDSGTVDLLAAWQDEQDRLQHRARVVWSDRELVVTTGRGTPINRNNYRRTLRMLCGRADIEPPITPYELRHTAISHQADMGHSSWQIADWAGTSERMISERYRHKLSGISSLGPVQLKPHSLPSDSR
ncbi:MAG: site-specific integrase [Acidimicrobiales bacterium]